MANGHGGSRPGSGRKSTKHEYVDDGLQTPLQLMLEQMRDEGVPMNIRLDIAYKAAPYCHARLQATEFKADVTHEVIEMSE